MKKVQFKVAAEDLEPFVADLMTLRQMLISKKVHGDSLLYNKHLKKWTKIRNTKGFRTLVTEIEKEIEVAEQLAMFPKKGISADENQLLPTNKNKDLLDISVDKGNPKKGITVKKLDAPSHSWIPRIKIVIVGLCGMVLSAFLAIIVFTRLQGDRTVVTGLVLIDGKPLKSGILLVEKQSDDQIYASGPIDSGSYSILSDKLKEGEYVARIWSIPSSAGIASIDFDNASHKLVYDFLKGQKSGGQIAKEYNVDSSLKITITSNTLNSHDFFLRTKDNSAKK